MRPVKYKGQVIIFFGIPEPNPRDREAVIESFRGKSSWLVSLVFLMMLVFLAFGVICVFNFFQAEATQEMIAWACGFMWSLTFIAMSKVWYWMELNKIAVTREIKRFEWQLARLSRRLEEASASADP